MQSATAASPSGCSTFLTMFSDRFHAHMSRLGDDRDEAFLRACSYRHSPFRSFVQNATGAKETLSDSVVEKVAQSPDLAAIRKDVVSLVQCMTQEQLVDVLSSAVPHFKQLWLSAHAGSFEARQRLLREVDELTFEATLNLIAERSRFRLIALECYERHQVNLELEKGLLKQILDYLFGKGDGKSAAVTSLNASLASKAVVMMSISVSVTAAVGVGVHYHVVDKFRPAAAPAAIVAPAPATMSLQPPVPVASDVPAASVTTVPVDAHKQPIPAPAADSKKHDGDAQAAAKKDSHAAAKDAHKTAGAAKTVHAPKTEDTQKNDVVSMLKKAGMATATETVKDAVPSAKGADAEDTANSQTTTTTKKKGGGLFGFLKHKNKDKTSTDTANNGQTKTDTASAAKP